MMDYPIFGSSYRESLKVLEADIQHANFLAASIPRAKGGACLQMKLVYNHLALISLFLIQWIDCSFTCLLPSYLSLFHITVYKVFPDGRPSVSSCGRRATVREFYAMILPSLQHLHGNSSMAADGAHEEAHYYELATKNQKGVEEKKQLKDVDLEREDECGICLEPCTKIVLPSCCHSMCINCYHDWNTRSKSCPFCRGSLKRVSSGDLWVLTCRNEAADIETVSKEDVLRFFLYIKRLPKDLPDALFLVYYEYLI